MRLILPCEVFGIEEFRVVAIGAFLENLGLPFPSSFMACDRIARECAVGSGK